MRFTSRAFMRAELSEASTTEESIPMMAMTTRSSIRVKPLPVLVLIFLQHTTLSIPPPPSFLSTCGTSDVLHVRYDWDMELFHVINRGIDGRPVFMDTRDRARFVHDLYEFNDTAPAPEFNRSLA